MLLEVLHQGRARFTCLRSTTKYDCSGKLSLTITILLSPWNNDSSCESLHPSTTWWMAKHKSFRRHCCVKHMTLTWWVAAPSEKLFPPPGLLKSLLASYSFLGAQNVWGWEKDGHGRHHQVERKDDEAKPVNYHGSKLPIVSLLCSLVVLLDFMRDKTQLVENGQKLTPGRTVSHVLCTKGVS